MPQTHWREADRDTFARAWAAEVAEVPEFTDSEIHIVAGLLLPIWKRLPNESTRVYRLQTDAGERIIGRKVSPAWVAGALEAGTSNLSPDDAFTALIDGKTILDLAEGLQRQARPRDGCEPHRIDRLHRARCGIGCAPTACSARSFRGSCVSLSQSMRPVLRSSPRFWSAIRSRASPIGRRRDMPRNAAELAHRLAREAEAVCRHYLSNGRRVGNYWQVGDVRNTPADRCSSA